MALTSKADVDAEVIRVGRALRLGGRAAGAIGSLPGTPRKGSEVTTAADPGHHPDLWQHGLALAQQYLQVGHPEEAAQFVEMYLAKQPGDANALLVAGEVALARGDNAKAARLFQGSLDRNPKQKAAVVRLALTQVDLAVEAPVQRAFDVAGASLKKAMAVCPGDAGIFNARVALLRAQWRAKTDAGAGGEAQAYAEELESLIIAEKNRRPWSVGLHQCLTDHYLTTGRLKHAFSHVVQVSRFDSELEWQMYCTQVCRRIRQEPECGDVAASALCSMLFSMVACARLSLGDPEACRHAIVGLSNALQDGQLAATEWRPIKNELHAELFLICGLYLLQGHQMASPEFDSVRLAAVCILVSAGEARASAAEFKSVSPMLPSRHSGWPAYEQRFHTRQAQAIHLLEGIRGAFPDPSFFEGVCKLPMLEVWRHFQADGASLPEFLFAPDTRVPTVESCLAHINRLPLFDEAGVVQRKHDLPIIVWVYCSWILFRGQRPNVRSWIDALFPRLPEHCTKDSGSGSNLRLCKDDVEAFLTAMATKAAAEFGHTVFSDGSLSVSHVPVPDEDMPLVLRQFWATALQTQQQPQRGMGQSDTAMDPSMFTACIAEIRLKFSLAEAGLDHALLLALGDHFFKRARELRDLHPSGSFYEHQQVALGDVAARYWRAACDLAEGTTTESKGRHPNKPPAKAANGSAARSAGGYGRYLGATPIDSPPNQHSRTILGVFCSERLATGTKTELATERARVFLSESLVRQRKFTQALTYLQSATSLAGVCNRGHVRLQCAGTLLAKLQRERFQRVEDVKRLEDLVKGALHDFGLCELKFQEQLTEAQGAIIEQGRVYASRLEAVIRRVDGASGSPRPAPVAAPIQQTPLRGVAPQAYISPLKQRLAYNRQKLAQLQSAYTRQDPSLMRTVTAMQFKAATHGPGTPNNSAPPATPRTSATTYGIGAHLTPMPVMFSTEHLESPSSAQRPAPPATPFSASPALAAATGVALHSPGQAVNPVPAASSTAMSGPAAAPSQPTTSDIASEPGHGTGGLRKFSPSLGPLPGLGPFGGGAGGVAPGTPGVLAFPKAGGFAGLGAATGSGWSTKATTTTTSTFGGTATPLFASLSPGKKDDERPGAGAGAGGEDKPIDQSDQIVTLKKVELTTGEEGETVVFEEMAKLFRFGETNEGPGWKERAKNTVKLLASADGGLRLVMRRDAVTGRLAANHRVTPEMTLKPMAGRETAFVWFALDHADGEEEPARHQFAIRFGTKEKAERFKAAFEGASTPGPAPAAAATAPVTAPVAPVATPGAHVPPQLAKTSWSKAGAPEKQAAPGQVPTGLGTIGGAAFNFNTAGGATFSFGGKASDKAAAAPIAPAAAPSPSPPPSGAAAAPTPKAGAVSSSPSGRSTSPEAFAGLSKVASGGKPSFLKPGTASVFGAKKSGETSNGGSPTSGGFSGLAGKAGGFAGLGAATGSGWSTKATTTTTSTFGGTATPLFASLSPGKKDDERPGAGAGASGEDKPIDQSDQIVTLKKVELTTGEEGETVVFEEMAKLFRFGETNEGPGWKERAKNTVKLLASADGGLRLVMRRDAVTGRLAANHRVTPEMTLKPMAGRETAFVWFALDHADGEEEPARHQFAIRFGTKEKAERFKAAFEEAKDAALARGVKKEVFSAGDGKTFPLPGQTVVVHYTGTLTDGKKFDSSRDRGKPFEFVIGGGRVIKGWDVGLRTMSKGEQALLTLTPEFGYGAKGKGPIPPDSTLIFDVELVAVKGSPAPDAALKATISAAQASQPVAQQKAAHAVVAPPAAKPALSGFSGLAGKAGGFAGLGTATGSGWSTKATTTTTSTFGGTATPLFASLSPGKKDDERPGAGAGAGGEDKPIDQSDQIVTLKKVELTTGEEGETVVFEEMAKLFRFGETNEGPGWKERAKNTVKLLASADGGLRLVMRRDAVTGRLAANHRVTPEMTLKPMAGRETAFVWFALDHADGEEEPARHQFAIRFGTKEKAERFKAAFEGASSGAPAPAPAATVPATAAAAATQAKAVTATSSSSWSPTGDVVIVKTEQLDAEGDIFITKEVLSSEADQRAAKELMLPKHFFRGQGPWTGSDDEEADEAGVAGAQPVAPASTPSLFGGTAAGGGFSGLAGKAGGFAGLGTATGSGWSTKATTTTTSTFGGTATPLFASLSPGKKDDERPGAGAGASGEDKPIDQSDQIVTLKKVELTTGEEGETVVFEEMAKLFRFGETNEGPGWKERAKNTVKLLASADGGLRLVMRRDAVTGRLAANHRVTPEMTLKPMAGRETAFVWFALDHADGEEEPARHQFAIRFGTKEKAERFKAAFEGASTPGPAPAAGTTPAQSPAAPAVAAPGAAAEDVPAAPAKASGFAAQRKAGAWNCDSCLTENEASKLLCLACDASQPGKEEEAAKAKQAAAAEAAAKKKAVAGLGTIGGGGFRFGTGGGATFSFGGKASDKAAAAPIAPAAAPSPSPPPSGAAAAPTPKAGAVSSSPSGRSTSPEAFAGLSKVASGGKPSFLKPGTASVFGAKKSGETSNGGSPTSGGFSGLAGKAGGFAGLGAATGSGWSTKATTTTTSTFGGTATPLFASLSPGKKDDERPGAGAGAGGEDKPIDQSDQIVTLKKVELTTGEEGETVVFEEMAKLFRFGETNEGPGWKERAKNTVKLLASADGGLRLVMRRDAVTGRLAANHRVTPEMTLKPMAGRETAFVWFALDHADGEEEPARHQFAIRFGTKEKAERFKAAFEGASSGAPAPAPAATVPATAAAAATQAKAVTATSSSSWSPTGDVVIVKTEQLDAEGDIFITKEVLSSEADQRAAKELMLPKHFFRGQGPWTGSDDEEADEAGVAGAQPVAPASTPSLFGGTAAGGGFSGLAGKAGGFAGLGTATGSGWSTKATTTTTSTFGGNTTPLFASLSPGKKDDERPGAGAGAGGEDKPIDQSDQIVTLKKVELTTGEEGETVVFEEMAKLFRFGETNEGPGWKERAKNTVKLLASADGGLRLVMRRDAVTGRLAANHRVTPEMTLKPMAGRETAFVWFALDHADGEEEPARHQFAIRFGTKEKAERFKAAFEGASTPGPAPAAGTTPAQSPAAPAVAAPGAAAEDVPAAPAKASGFAAQRKAGAWNCDSCLTENEASKLLCLACDASQPGKEEEAAKAKQAAAAEAAAKKKAVAGLGTIGGGGFRFGTGGGATFSFGGKASDKAAAAPIAPAAAPSPSPPPSGAAAAPTPKAGAVSSSPSGRSTSPEAFAGLSKVASGGKPSFLKPGTASVFGAKKSGETSNGGSPTSGGFSGLAGKAGGFAGLGAATGSGWSTKATTTTTSTFGGTATPLFASLSPGKKDDERPGAGAGAGGEDKPIDQSDQIVTLKKVELTTGEEGETVVFEEMAKLFRFGETNEGPGWKERAKNTVKLLASADGGLRLVMRRDAVTGRLAANHRVTPEMTLKPMAGRETAFVWFALDHADGEEEPARHQFAIRFGTKEKAERFKAAFEGASSGAPATAPATSVAAPQAAAAAPSSPSFPAPVTAPTPADAAAAKAAVSSSPVKTTVPGFGFGPGGGAPLAFGGKAFGTPSSSDPGAAAEAVVVQSEPTPPSTPPSAAPALFAGLSKAASGGKPSFLNSGTASVFAPASLGLGTALTTAASPEAGASRWVGGGGFEIEDGHDGDSTSEGGSDNDSSGEPSDGGDASSEPDTESDSETTSLPAFPSSTNWAARAANPAPVSTPVPLFAPAPAPTTTPPTATAAASRPTPPTSPQRAAPGSAPSTSPAAAAPPPGTRRIIKAARRRKRP